MAGRIRVGTFNVNGKFPSQDLSAWVRREEPRTAAAASAFTGIPPLKEISPLSLGEHQKVPIEGTISKYCLACLLYRTVHMEMTHPCGTLQHTPAT